MGENQKAMIKLCGLWKSQTVEGKTYYSGPLSYGTNLLLFPNTYKKSSEDKQLDLILYIAKREKKEKQQQDQAKDDVPF